MDNRGDQILIGLFVALIGAIAGAVANAIVNLLLAGKINFGNALIWVIIGSLGALLLSWMYRNIRRNRVIMYGYSVAIRTHDHNYVTADLNRDHQLFGRAQNIKAWQIFEIVDASKPFSQKSKQIVRYGDKIALKALNNDRFVGADLNNEKQLTTWASEVRGWETLTLCLTPEGPPANEEKAIRYGDSFALRAFNDKYASYKLTGDGRLLAVADEIKSWERFVFIDPSHP